MNNKTAKGKWNEYLASGLVHDIGSFHWCLTINALSKSGLAKLMAQKDSFSPEDFSPDFNQHILSHLFSYLEIRNFIKRTEPKNQFKLTEYGHRCLSQISLAQIGFYVESYAPVLFYMDALMTNTETYGDKVQRDGRALGKHCAELFTVFHTEIILDIIKDKKLTHILDLGCGGGAMLIDACKSNSTLNGYGLDISEGAIKFANELSKREGLQSRLSFSVGDAFEPSTWPSYSKLDAICAVGTLHEHFRDGEEAVIKMLNLYGSLISQGKANYFILGEPELYFDNLENDPDLFLIHIFTAQGFPRRRELWMDVISKSNLKCHKVYTRRGIGPRFCFYVLGL